MLTSSPQRPIFIFLSWSQSQIVLVFHWCSLASLEEKTVFYADLYCVQGTRSLTLCLILGIASGILFSSALPRRASSHIQYHLNWICPYFNSRIDCFLWPSHSEVWEKLIVSYSSFCFLVYCMLLFGRKMLFLGNIN